MCSRWTWLISVRADLLRFDLVVFLSSGVMVSVSLPFSLIFYRLKSPTFRTMFLMNIWRLQSVMIRFSANGASRVTISAAEGWLFGKMWRWVRCLVLVLASLCVVTRVCVLLSDWLCTSVRSRVR